MNAALTRRALLGAGGALVVSFSVPAAAANKAARRRPPPMQPCPAASRRPRSLDAWIRVGADGLVTVFTGKAELGQGLKTAIIQIAAEQLAVATSRIDLVTADTGRTPDEGFTAGSHSMQDSGTAILHAAAQVRALLLGAAAQQLGLDLGALHADGGAVHASDGRSVAYGALASALSLHVRAKPASALTPPASYRVMGTPLPRVDIPAKVTGGPAYVQDIRMHGMLHARVIRQPSAGAVLRSVDTAAVEHMPGVVKVVRDGSWLAVVATGEWQAVKAMRALAAAAQWEESASLPDQATIAQTIRALPARDIPILTWTAPTDAPTGAPVKRLKARYTRPYQMHASIGPSCAVALFGRTTPAKGHGLDAYPGRLPAARRARRTASPPPEKVRCIHVEGSGCYGHNGADDVAADAALVARAMPGKPVRVQWMREQEHTSEPYGPAMVAEVRARSMRAGRSSTGITACGAIPTIGARMSAACSCRMPRCRTRCRFRHPRPSRCRKAAASGTAIRSMPSRMRAWFRTSFPTCRCASRRLRSLGAYLNIFAIESFMDELAEAAAVDPVAFRLRHLHDERARDVVRTAADRFGWSDPPPRQPGHGRGFAFARYKNLGAYCAVALDLSVEPETGRVRLGRVVAAVDSGQPINPDGIRNQIEGAIVQSASWTLYEAVRFDRRYITSTRLEQLPDPAFPRRSREHRRAYCRAARPAISRHRRSRPGADRGRDRECGT